MYTEDFKLSRKALNLSSHISLAVGLDSSVGIATRYRLDGPGIEDRWGRHSRTLSDWPWGPASLLYNGYRITFPGLKRPELDVNHPQPSRKSRTIILLRLWAFMACHRATFYLSTSLPFNQPVYTELDSCALVLLQWRGKE